MVLRLYNTLTRHKEAFEPLDAQRVRMYVCGPTVYQRIHLGNARAFVVFDVLYRLLRHLYGEKQVVYARNITDIDDKIMDAAAKSGESIRELTDRTALQFQGDLKALGCLPPTFEPRATEHVGDMIRLIEDLIARGHAYAAEGHVLFNVPSWPDYGRLSGRNRDEQIAGARVDVAPYKRDPADFVLWKSSAEGQPGWDSPWSRGRPGWHIECSAMSERLLGVPFDIHAGGLDLIFPHHENEIAQSCCAHGTDAMARYWLHNGFLEMRGEKMSKSLGNILQVRYALKTVEGEAIRLFLLSAHYRQPLVYSQSYLYEARSNLRKFRGAVAIGWPALTEAPPDEEFLNSLKDDLNMPAAIARLHAMVNEIRWAEGKSEQIALASSLRESAKLIGLLEEDSPIKRQSESQKGMIEAIESSLQKSDLEAMIQKRTELRKAKKWDEADAVRDELLALGIILEDRPDGTSVPKQSDS